MGNAYVDVTFVKAVGSMPSADIDAIETDFPTSFATIAEAVSAEFDAKLMKRYEAPFGLDANGAFSLDRVPVSLKFKVCDVVLARLWAKRGFNPGSKQDEDAIMGARDRSYEWLNEAADAEKGFIELPRRPLEGLHDESAITKGRPLGYSETSPYVSMDRQSRDGRADDARRRGR